MAGGDNTGDARGTETRHMSRNRILKKQQEVMGRMQGCDLETILSPEFDPVSSGLRCGGQGGQFWFQQPVLSGKKGETILFFACFLILC